MMKEKELRKKDGGNEEALKHDILTLLANRPALVLTIHPICLLKTFKF